MKALNKVTPEEQDKINSLIGMIDSCFTYGGAERTDYNFERYIKPHEEKLGKELFEKTYNWHINELKNNFKIEKAVYTDCEGLTYNSLKRI